MKIELVKFKFETIKNLRVATSRSVIKDRQVFQLKFKNEKTIFAFGEAAPLDGYSIDSTITVKETLENIDFPFHYDFNSLTEFEELLQKKFSETPSIIFAFEQAFIKLALKSNLLPNDEKISLFREKLFSNQNFCSYSALLYTLIENRNIENLTNLVNDEKSVIKIKLPRKLNKSKLHKIEKNKNLRFRFDANGTWSFEEALENITFLRKLNLNIDFIEDPTSNLNDNIILSHKFPKIIALDLSINNFNEYLTALENGIKVFVIKPMFFGGISKLLDFIEQAKGKDGRVIISTSFESKIGLSFVNFIASFLKNEIHGLGLQLDNSIKNNKICFTKENLIEDVF